MEEQKSNAPKFLTQEQSEQRFKQIKQESIHYQLFLHLQLGDSYLGNIHFTFDAVHIDQDLFIDFNNEAVKKLVINGKQIEEIKYDKLFIQLAKENLIVGPNEAYIEFSCKYARDGTGLHSFTDADGLQYLYSQCEAYLCNRIFPNFDQPNLKAYLSCKIKAPKDWRVLANENAIEVTVGEQEQDLTFAKTKLIPTYIYGFVAGPYLEIKGTNTYKNIPMSLFSRVSLFEHLQKQADFMFETTNGAMKVYEEFFGVDYPFSKYDQLFVPEFNMGAMENAGLVTFNDQYCFREEVDSSKNTWLADVVTHELSHMWFGNLVTMHWWNDLWLNESFADFISHWCLSKYEIKSKQLQNIWLAFNKRKNWGYRQDQLVTTHPIAGDVANTEAAESIFDGITYSKGASTLRQLLALIGEESFSKGLNSYFKTFAYKNTVLDDFINHLNVEFEKKQLGFDLKEWKQMWICTAGLNECQPIFDPKQKAQDSELVIVQTPALADHNTLRFHKMKVAFFNQDASVITSQDVLLLPQSDTRIKYDGSKNYAACLLNYEDETFIKVLLDEYSIEVFKEHLHKIQDALTRTLIWRAFLDMVRDGKICSEEYFAIFINQIPLEQSEDIVTNQFLFLTMVANFTPKYYKPLLFSRVFDFIVDYLQQIKNKKSLVIAVKAALPVFAVEESRILDLIDWYQGKNQKLQEFEIGRTLEWDIVVLAHKYKYLDNNQKNQLFQQQSEKDKSDTQKYMEAQCKALLVTPEERLNLWNSYLPSNKNISLRHLQYSWDGFNNEENTEDIKLYWDKWFDSIQDVYEKEAKDFSNHFFSRLFPKTEDFEYLQTRFQKLLQSLNKEKYSIIRAIREAQDDLSRKEKAFSCFNNRACCIMRD